MEESTDSMIVEASSNGHDYLMRTIATINGSHLLLRYNALRDDGIVLKDKVFEEDFPKATREDLELLTENKFNNMKFYFYRKVGEDSGRDLAPREHITGMNLGDGLILKMFKINALLEDKNYLATSITGGKLEHCLWTYHELHNGFRRTNPEIEHRPVVEYRLPETKLLAKTDDVLKHYI